MESALGKKRNVFPRWRSRSRIPGDELRSCDAYKPAVDLAAHKERFAFLYKKWREHPSLETAAEVLDSAVLIPDPYLAYGPAKAVLNDEAAMPSIKRVAAFILDGQNKLRPEEASWDPVLANAKGDTIAKIRQIKKRLFDEPRNTLLWLEKARLQTQISDIAGARASMHTALGSSPENREVLRAYARFMVHIGETRAGHERLLESSRLQHDPWLQAAELALAQSANRPPQTVKNARRALSEKKFADIHLSELAAALGTLEFFQGAHSLATKHFKQSLEAPTENALSQAVWLREMVNANITIPTTKLSVPCAFEARAHASVSVRKWSEAVMNCKLWVMDEPFSLRAAIDGSFIASSFAWDAAAALDICDFGLIANPTDSVLLNNRAVALIRLNRLNEAEVTLGRIRFRGDDPSIEPFIPATHGLLEFAKGNFELGRTGYKKAIDSAIKRNASETQFRALAHWVYEEIVARNLSKETSDLIIKQMDEMAANYRFVPASADLWATMKERIASTFLHRRTSSEPELPLLVSEIEAVRGRLT